MRNIILCDIDHVVSHAAPRDHLLGGDWDIYHAEQENDKLCHDIACLLASFRVACFYNVAITSRPEKWRGLTQKWLLQNNVPFDEILMRPDDNYMPAGELKVFLAKQRFGDDLTKEILCVIDDHEEVIKAFRNEGLTCLMCYGRDY